MNVPARRDLIAARLLRQTSQGRRLWMVHSRYLGATCASLILALIVGCGQLPAEVRVECTQLPAASQQIALGMFGPEDLALDVSAERPRLIISSQNRRATKTRGKIFHVDLVTHEIREMPRRGEPAQLINSFHPHGLDLAMIDDRKVLYVVVHGTEEWIVRYTVLENELVYDKTLGPNEELTNPNDVDADAHGNIYVTNSSTGKSFLVNWLKSNVLGMRTTPTLRLSPKGWESVADLAKAPNGVLIHGNYLLIGDSLADTVTIHPLPGSTGQKKVLEMSMPDNMSEGPDHDVLTASHNSRLSFMLHRSEIMTAGGSIFRITDIEGSPTLNKVFITDGTMLSAPSSAVYFNNTLYIGQVFDPFILAVPVRDLKQAHVCAK